MIAWLDSKQDSLTVLVRLFLEKKKSTREILEKFRKIVRPDAPAMVSTVLNQRQLQKSQQQPFLLSQHRQLGTQSLFWVLPMQITNHSLLTSTVNIRYFLKKFILFSGNINEDVAFEYGDGTTAIYGCGTTLNNEFWYFGGNIYTRQVI